MGRPTNEDLELYVMGAYDGDSDELEAFLGRDSAARDTVAQEAALELVLRQVAEEATFCSVCDDVVREQRCDACGAAVSAGGFAIDGVLVQNAHGRLYLARDADGRRVALKELAFVQSPSPEAFAAFEREAKFLRALDHVAVPRFVASFQEGTGVHTRFYLAQEYIDGVSLDRRLADHWFDEAEIIDVARQVLAVLVYLQGLSPMVVHRDIKPANLVQRTDGSIAVVDFGAAYDQGATVGSTAIGTFGYMPLEQMAGEVDATTDPFALGASLFHLLTRREPWKVLESPELAATNVSEGLRGFLDRLIARERADRYPSATDALDALDALGRGEIPALRPSTDLARPARRMTGWRPYLAGAGIAVVTLGLGVSLVADGEQHRADARNARDAQAAALAPAVEVTAGAEPTAEVAPATALLPYPGLPRGDKIDLAFEGATLREALQHIADAGALNLVVPEHVTGTVTVDLQAVPWDQALEVILESKGLWYRYHPASQLVRIAPRDQLDHEARMDAQRTHRRAEWDERLGYATVPDGEKLDLELRDAPIREVLRLLSDVGAVNVVVPDDVQSNLSVRMKAVPWNRAMDVVLRAAGLGYRYRARANVIRVAPLDQLDHEDRMKIQRIEASRPVEP